ncbi:MAG: DUF2064 domain-containing protein [Pseudomonadota bacterium]
MAFDLHQQPVLILMAKRPAPGVGKQRIARQFGIARTARLAELLWLCAVEDVAAWPHERVISIASAADTEWAQSALPSATVIHQPAGNLGVRIQHAHKQFDQPGRPILFIGSDAPELDLVYLNECLKALETFDVVLGQAADGGVVVMGSRAPWPALAKLPWSTASLGAALRAACESAGLSLVLREPLEDIDTFDQLAALPGALANDGRAARRALRDWVSANLTVSQPAPGALA